MKNTFQVIQWLTLIRSVSFEVNISTHSLNDSRIAEKLLVSGPLCVLGEFIDAFLFVR